jgi:hypothetical protein
VKIHVLKYIEDQKCSIICYLQVLCHTTVDIFFAQIRSNSIKINHNRLSILKHEILNFEIRMNSYKFFRALKRVQNCFECFRQFLIQLNFCQFYVFLWPHKMYVNCMITKAIRLNELMMANDVICHLQRNYLP